VAEVRGRYSNSEGDVRLRTDVLWLEGAHDLRPQDGSIQVYLEGRSTPEPDLGKLEDVDRSGNEEISHFQNSSTPCAQAQRNMLTAEINETYLSTAFCLLGNISYRLKRELHFDPATNHFIGDHEADEIAERQVPCTFLCAG